MLLLGSLLERVDSFKYLGLKIKCDLTWTDHIKGICSKARRLVGLLFRQFYHYAEPSTIKTLYLTRIRPNLEYASTIWDPYLIKDRKLLEDVQKFACKICVKDWHLAINEWNNLSNDNIVSCTTGKCSKLRYPTSNLAPL